MRIAILTLPLHTNYGGILQAYALQTILERMGHKVHILTPPPYKAHNIWIMPVVYAFRVYKKYILRQDVSILYDGQKRCRQNTDKFIKKHISSFVVHGWAELKNKFDAIIVGSDQIWRWQYAKSFPGIENAFLAFAESWKIKRVSYAASFGLNKLEYSEEEIEKCSKLLKGFDLISVREKTGVSICRERFGMDAECLIDPTLLLSCEEYTRLYKARKTKKNSGTLACYILDENDTKNEIILEIAKWLGMKPFNISSEVENSCAAPHKRIQPHVEQWLKSINESSFIITDSFHACVFAIIFHKQFAVIPNTLRGNSRIESLLSILNLETRIIHNSTEVKKLTKIDYNLVDQILESEREKATRFLYRI